MLCCAVLCCAVCCAVLCCAVPCRAVPCRAVPRRAVPCRAVLLYAPSAFTDNRCVMHFAVHDYDHTREDELRLMNRVCWYDSLAPTSIEGVAPALLPGAVVPAGTDDAKTEGARL